MSRVSLTKNRKAQIAETMTWVVATIIIIFLLIASVYVSVILGKTKVIDKTSVGGLDSNLWISYKNQIALNINNANENQINVWLGENDLDGS